MALGNLSIDYSERLYNALLSLYPIRFRIRFAPEMMQLFRDCCRDALEKGEVAVIVAFWLRVMRDLMVSAVQERGREWFGSNRMEHPFVRALDLVLIPSIVTVNLVALGPVLTLLFRNGALISADEFFMTSGFFSLVIGVLAVAVSLVMTRLRPTVRLWVKLSA